MSSYPTGIVCILTQINKNSYSAIIVNSFSSVSLKPLIVLWSLDIKSKKFRYFRNSKKQTVVILGYKQKKIANEIAFKNPDINFKRFKDILDNSICFMDCANYKSIKIGDHYTNFLKIKKISDVKKTKSLVYFKKKFTKI